MQISVATGMESPTLLSIPGAHLLQCFVSCVSKIFAFVPPQPMAVRDQLHLSHLLEGSEQKS